MNSFWSLCFLYDSSWTFLYMLYTSSGWTNWSRYTTYTEEDDKLAASGKSPLILSLNDFELQLLCLFHHRFHITFAIYLPSYYRIKTKKRYHQNVRKMIMLIMKLNGDPIRCYEIAGDSNMASAIDLLAWFLDWPAFRWFIFCLYISTTLIGPSSMAYVLNFPNDASSCYALWHRLVFFV